MLLKSISFVSIAALFCAGCGHRSRGIATSKSVDEARTNGFDAFSSQPAERAGGGSGLARVRNAMIVLGEPVFAAGRFVAVRHRLEIIEPGPALQKSVEAVVAYCGSIQCEVLSSNISGTAADAIPGGNISVRVAPPDLNKFLDFVGKQGRVSQHATETEDKTAQVIDVEAKIKNQTEFRDNLRRMLAKPGVSVADLLQIQEKLAEAQAELDSEATQRKVLANETEKVAVDVAFHSEIRSTSRGAFASVGEALRESGTVLGDSLAALITAVAALIPWLIVIIPGMWFLVKAWRRFRRNRKSAGAAPEAAQQKS